MIDVELHDSEDNLITVVRMRHAPSKSEILWVLRQNGTKSAYLVTDIAHWVSDEIEYHKVCAYVKAL